MSKAQWPKIRARTYRWQDKSGTVLEYQAESKRQRHFVPSHSIIIASINRLLFVTNTYTYLWHKEGMMIDAIYL